MLRLDECTHMKRETERAHAFSFSFFLYHKWNYAKYFL